MAEIVIKQFWHELYIEMQTNPMDTRTDKEFTTELGLNHNTFMSWKRSHKDQIYKEVQKRRSEYVNELRAFAYKCLADKMKGSVDAIKLAFQLMGDLVEKIETKTDYMNDNDKIRRAEALYENIRKKKAAWAKASGSLPETSNTDKPLELGGNDSAGTGVSSDGAKS